MDSEQQDPYSQHRMAQWAELRRSLVLLHAQWPAAIYCAALSTDQWTVVSAHATVNGRAIASGEWWRNHANHIPFGLGPLVRIAKIASDPHGPYDQLSYNLPTLGRRVILVQMDDRGWVASACQPSAHNGLVTK